MFPHRVRALEASRRIAGGGSLAEAAVGSGRCDHVHMSRVFSVRSPG
jgi:hypothetical protein